MNRTNNALWVFLTSILLFLFLVQALGLYYGGIDFIRSEAQILLGTIKYHHEWQVFYKLIVLNFSRLFNNPVMLLTFLFLLSLLLSSLFKYYFILNKKTDAVNTDTIKRGPHLITAALFKKEVEDAVINEANEISYDLEEDSHYFDKNSFIDEQLADGFRASYKKDSLTIPDIFLSRHLAFVGTTGAGKSTQIKHLLEYINRKQQKSIILDINGEIYSELGSENDIILSPFDERSARWDFDKELLNGQSIDPSEYSKYLVPEGGKGNSFWWKGARSVLSEIIRNYKNSNSILEALGGDKESVVKNISTIAQNIIGKIGTPQEAGILGSLSCDLLFLNHLVEHNNRSTKDYFSICEWANSKNTSNLYLVVSDSQLEAISSLYRTWVSLAILARFEAGPDNDLPPLNFIIDEFPTLGRMEMVEKALARLRKYGGRVVLGYQGESQLSALYGDKNTSSMIGLIGTMFIFRTQEESDAKKLARHIGRSEVVSVSENESEDKGKLKGGKSVSRSTSYKDIVLDSEIATLPDGHFYLKALHINPVKSRIQKKKWNTSVIDILIPPRPPKKINRAPTQNVSTELKNITKNTIRNISKNEVFLSTQLPRRLSDTRSWFN